jgi:hypothetical protein
MKNSDLPQPNPALEDLEFLNGEWEMEISNAAFLPDRSARMGRPFRPSGRNPVTGQSGSTISMDCIRVK